jgi:hypothetical protein
MIKCPFGEPIPPERMIVVSGITLKEFQEALEEISQAMSETTLHLDRIRFSTWI